MPQLTHGVTLALKLRVTPLERTQEMTILEVPGAGLYYHQQGVGPLLVVIPGGNGTAYMTEPLAQSLATRFTVVTYDRRGFSRCDNHLDHSCSTPVVRETGGRVRTTRSAAIG